MDRIGIKTEEARIELARAYKYVLDRVDLSYYRQATDILNELKRNNVIAFGKRAFRTMVEDVNYLFQYGYLKTLIVSSREGYKIASSKEEVERYLKTKKAQFIALAKNYRSLKTAISRMPNMYYDFDKGEIK